MHALCNNNTYHNIVVTIYESQCIFQKYKGTAKQSIPSRNEILCGEMNYLGLGIHVVEETKYLSS